MTTLVGTTSRAAIVLLLLIVLETQANPRPSTILPCNASLSTMIFNVTNMTYRLSNCDIPKLRIVVSASNVSVWLTDVTVASVSVIGGADGIRHTDVHIVDSVLNACAEASLTAPNKTHDLAAVNVSSVVAENLFLHVANSFMYSCNASALHVFVVKCEGDNVTIAIERSSLQSTFDAIATLVLSASMNASAPARLATAVISGGNGSLSSPGGISIVSTMITLRLSDEASRVENYTTLLTPLPRCVVHVLSLGPMRSGSFYSLGNVSIGLLLLDQSSHAPLLSLLLSSNATSSPTLPTFACVSIREASGALLAWSNVSCAGGHVLQHGVLFGASSPEEPAESMLPTRGLSFILNGGQWSAMRGFGALLSFGSTWGNGSCLVNSSLTLQSVMGEWWGNTSRDSPNALHGAPTSLLVEPRGRSIVNASITIRCSLFEVILTTPIVWELNATRTILTQAFLAVPPRSSWVQIWLDDSKLVASPLEGSVHYPTNTITSNASFYSPLVSIVAFHASGNVSWLHARFSTTRLELPKLETSWNITILQNTTSPNCTQNSTLNSSNSSSGNSTISNNSSGCTPEHTNSSNSSSSSSDDDNVTTVSSVIVGTGWRSFSQLIYAPLNISNHISNGTLEEVLSLSCVFLTRLGGGGSPPVRVDSGPLSALGEHLPVVWTPGALNLTTNSSELQASYSVDRPLDGLPCNQRDGCFVVTSSGTRSVSDPSRTPSRTASWSKQSPSPTVTQTRTLHSQSMTHTHTTFGSNVSASMSSALSALDLLTTSAEIYLRLNGTWFPPWGLRGYCASMRFVPTSFNYSLGSGDTTGLNDHLTPVGIVVGTYVQNNATIFPATSSSLIALVHVPSNSDVFRQVDKEPLTIWFSLDPRCTVRGDVTLYFSITIQRIEPFQFRLDGVELQVMQDVSLAIAFLAALPILSADVARVTMPLNVLRCTPLPRGVPLRHYQSFVGWNLVVDETSEADQQLGFYFGTIAVIGCVWIGCLLLHVGFIGLYKVVTATTFLKGSIDAYFPSLLILPLFALLQPMVMSVTAVVQEGSMDGSLWVGVAGGAVTLAVCVMVTMRHACCFVSIFDEDAVASDRTLALRLFLGSSLWSDHPNEEVLKYTQRHRLWFHDFRGPFHWVFLMEMWISLVVGVLEGLHLGESSCMILVWVAGGIYFARMLFYAIARPYDGHLWNITTTVISASEALLCATIIAYDWIDIADQQTRAVINDVADWDIRASVLLLVVSSGFGIVRLLLYRFVDSAEAEYRSRGGRGTTKPQLGALPHDAAEVLKLVEAICDDVAERSAEYDPSLQKAFVSAHLELMLPGCEEEAERSLLEVLREFDVAALESGNKSLFTHAMEVLFERLAVKYAGREPSMLREDEGGIEVGAAHAPLEKGAVLRSSEGSMLTVVDEGAHLNDIELQEFSPAASRPSFRRIESSLSREQSNRNGLSHMQRQQFLDDLLS